MNRVVDTRIVYKINLKETHKNTEFDEALFVNVAACACGWFMLVQLSTYHASWMITRF